MGAKFYLDIPEAPSFFAVDTSGGANHILLQWVNSGVTVHGNPLDTLSAAQVWRNDSLIVELPIMTMNDTLSYSDIIPRGDYFRYKICMIDTSGQPGRQLYGNEAWYGESIHGVLIWDLDSTPITGSVIQQELFSNGFTANDIYMTQSSDRYPIDTTVQAIFVCLGIYPNNHVLSASEGTRLKNYLDAGGNLYMEGGDTWCFDTQTAVHPYFNLNPEGDGTSDLSFVDGQANTVYENMHFIYAGENSYMDRISPKTGSQQILRNPSNNFGAGIAHNTENYRTIAASFELGGLQDGAFPATKRELIRLMLQFFGIMPIHISEKSANPGVPTAFSLSQNYPNPFNSRTQIRFGVPEAGKVRLRIYNIIGQLVYESAAGDYQPGWHIVVWDGNNRYGVTTSSGVYFYQIRYQTHRGKIRHKTGKMYLMK